MISLLLGSSLFLTQGFATPLNDKKNAQLFLNAFESFLGVSPEDGRFGMSRLPTIHRSTGITEAGERHFLYLRESNYVAAFAFGHLKSENPRVRTLSSYYKLDFPENWFSGLRERVQKQEDLLLVKARSIATELFASKQKDRAQSLKFVNRDSIIYARKIFANDDKCLSCHADVKKGQPIGVIGLIQVPKA
jgi:hypothetical protein